MQNFFSNNDQNFYWFFGVVEDRDDPMRLGRVKVRIIGYHTDDKSELPTSDLPWAMPILPVTSAATSGIGHSPTGVVEGTWVFGFFIDGNEGQQPAVLGTLPGRPSRRANCSPVSGSAGGKSPSSSGTEQTDDGSGTTERQDIQNARNVSPNQEFWTLVAICSREASGVPHVCDVAQSILNRALSGEYGGRTIQRLVNADQQYEPTWKYPSAGTSGKANPQWRRIKDIRTAMEATGHDEATILSVARALKDPANQENSRNFVGPRTDFLGYGQPMIDAAKNRQFPIRCRDPKGESSNQNTRKEARQNKFGFSFNYKGAAGVANTPDWIKDAEI